MFPYKLIEILKKFVSPVTAFHVLNCKSESQKIKFEVSFILSFDYFKFKLNFRPSQTVLNMAPSNKNLFASGVLFENEVETIDGSLLKPAVRFADKRNFTIVWRNVIITSALHVFFLAGLWMLLTGKTKWQTNLLGK